MYHYPVAPLPLSLEQQWSDEVRYLHSLWHRGPPSHSIPNPKPHPQPLNATTINPSLAPSNPTSFKKKKKKKIKKIKLASDPDPVPVPSSVSTAWTFEPSPNLEAETGWPQLVSKPISTSVEEKEKLAALQLQRNYFKSCQDFFARNREDSDDDSDDDDDSMDEDEEDEDEGEEGSEEFDFFFGIFKEDEELRNYYKKNYEGGEFCCLVCGGIGQKIGKKFKDCVALVQHSTAISKTKKKGAHRAFGQVICRVLGWNIKRLPNIVLSLEDPLGGPLENKENVNGDNANTEADSVGIGLNENANNDVVDPEKGEQADGAAKILVHKTEEELDELDHSPSSDEEDVDELYEDL